MEESVSSSRTTAFHGANSYHYGHHHHQPPAPPPAAATATTASDFEDDDDSGWTAYFLQLPSDEEEDASASNRDVGAVSCGSGRGRGSASTVSKPNKDKDNNQVVKKVLKKGVKKTRIVDEEEDPLQDTASSPLVQLNINDGDLQEVWSTPAGGRDRLPVQRRRSSGDIVNGNGRIET